MSPRQPCIVVAVIQREGKVLAVPLGSTVPAPLWEFPKGEVQENEGAKCALKGTLRDRYGLGVEVGRLLKVETHSYPHAEWTVSVFSCTTDAPEATLEQSGMRWLGPEDATTWSGPENSWLRLVWDEPPAT